jgi:capsular polysaccharide biosynthesis protein
MSEQPLDIQTVLSVMRRHRRSLAALTLAGVVAGGALVHLRPPMYNSTASVLLPPPANASAGQGRDVATDVRVAMSDVVLGPAGAAVSPHMTPAEVRKRVTVSGTTSNVLEINAEAPTAHEAERLALAVANSEVDYQAQAASSVTTAQQEAAQQRSDALGTQLETVNQQIQATKRRQHREPTTSKQWSADATALAQLTAQQAILVLQIEILKEKASGTAGSKNADLIQAATPGKRRDLLTWTALAAALGGLLALGLSTMFVTMLSRRDRRLRTRDEVADAIGSAVIGSVATRPPRTAAGWSALMESYEPSVTDSWSLRQALDHVGLGDLTIRSSHGNERTSARGRTLTLITLSDDLRGLAVGPQLASHAAALGVRTRLVVKQGHESSAALWTACSSLRRTEEVRDGLFVDTRRRKGLDDLTVEMVVVDRRHPQFVDLDRSAVTLLAVASSSATAEDLAHTAVAAYEAGGRISGVIVADPDALDRTTGRLLLQQRSEQLPLPTRMTGLEQPGSADQTGRGGR